MISLHLRINLYTNFKEKRDTEAEITFARRRRVRLVRASACFSLRWKSLGDMMAGEMKRRHRKLVTAMNFTFYKRGVNESSMFSIHSIKVVYQSVWDVLLYM